MQRLKTIFTASVARIKDQQKNINQRVRQRLGHIETPSRQIPSLAQTPKHSRTATPPNNSQSNHDPPLHDLPLPHDQLYSLISRYLDDLHLRVSKSLVEAAANHPKVLGKKSQLNSSQVKSPPKDTANQDKQPAQQAKLRQAQKKRLQLMQQLRRLDHQLQEIKKAEGRVLSNNSKVDGISNYLNRSRLNSHVHTESELKKHEEAIRLIRKLNDEKKQRDKKKNKKQEEIKKAQQVEMQALLIEKAKEAEARRQKLARVVSHNQAMMKGSNEQNFSELQKLNGKSTYLPSISNKAPKDFSSTPNNKQIPKPSVEVSFDPSKKYFPKSKAYHQILREQKKQKNRDAQELQFKLQSLNRRNHYKKLQLIPISMTQSLSAAPQIFDISKDGGRSTEPLRIKELHSRQQPEDLPMSQIPDKQSNNFKNERVDTNKSESNKEANDKKEIQIIGQEVLHDEEKDLHKKHQHLVQSTVPVKI